MKLALIDNPNAIYLAHALYDECYKTQKLDKNNLCAICGNSILSSVGRLIRRNILGFNHRPNESPILCYPHHIGWSVSYTKTFYRPNNHNFNANDNEEINLLFATYLAKQLIKLTKLKEKQNG